MRLFEILCQRKCTQSISSQIKRAIKPTFEGDGQLRQGQVPVVDWHRPFLTGVLNAKIWQFEQTVVIGESPLVFFSLRNRRCTVKLHPKLTRLPPIFASNIDPRNHPTLADSDAGVPRSDRRGFIECNQTVAPA